MEPRTSDKTLSFNKLAGVNERAKYGNGELGEFDKLVGLYSPNIGSLKQVGGKLLLQHFYGEEVMSVHQTNDRGSNIIIQTNTHVYVASEADFFNRPIATNLVPVPINEEEDMAQAIIAHVVAAGGGGGGTSVSGAFTLNPFNQIVSQVNPDGSAAAFASLAGNIITLIAGSYRIRGWTLFSDAIAGTNAVGRIRISGGANLWAGLPNEYTEAEDLLVGNKNTKLEFGGAITLAVPTDIILEVKTSSSENNIGFGAPKAIAGSNDTYRWMEILKTN